MIIFIVPLIIFYNSGVVLYIITYFFSNKFQLKYCFTTDIFLPDISKY